MSLHICVIDPAPADKLPTFIRAHVERLPGKVTLISGQPPCLDGRPVPMPRIVARGLARAKRWVSGRPWQDPMTTAYVRALRQVKPDVVLSEWGPCSAQVAPACTALGVAQVAHFHGYDASVHRVLVEHTDAYRRLFDSAAIIVAVSKAMRRKLIALGAAPEKVCHNPYGVDCSRFTGGQPAEAEPTFIAVGRLVAKKAPLVTIGAFARLWAKMPTARLVLVGSGPLRGACDEAIRAGGLTEAVRMTGGLPHGQVQRLMRSARAFVQHSVEAADGDCEGTPNAVLEAGATGLPVVATRHAGIADVVVDGQTGLLVDEHDEAAMAAAMLRLAQDGGLAGRLGAAASRHIRTHYDQSLRIGVLADILARAADAPQSLRAAA